MHTIHNARIALLANLLNTIAGSSFAIGVLTPIAAVFFYSAAPAGLRLGSIVIGERSGATCRCLDCPRTWVRGRGAYLAGRGRAKSLI
jgi:hypothetical protein